MTDPAAEATSEPQGVTPSLVTSVSVEPLSPGPAPATTDEGRARPTPARADQGSHRQREREDGRGGGRRNGRGNGGGGRKTPAAEKNAAQPPGAAETPPEVAPQTSTAVEYPSTPFTHEGREWLARVVGLAASGRARPGVGAPMMLVALVPADDPEAPGLEALAVGRSLDGLSQEQLADLLARAHPAKLPKEREDIFSETRARKKSERSS